MKEEEEDQIKVTSVRRVWLLPHLKWNFKHFWMIYWLKYKNVLMCFSWLQKHFLLVLFIFFHASTLNHELFFKRSAGQKPDIKRKKTEQRLPWFQFKDLWIKIRAKQGVWWCLEEVWAHGKFLWKNGDCWWKYVREFGQKSCLRTRWCPDISYTLISPGYYSDRSQALL